MPPPCTSPVEEYRLEDAEVVLTAYGISARICKSAVELLRAQGVKAGLIRPITVHPFPYAAYDHIDYSKVKAVLDVEMSIPAQFVDDVAVAVKDRCLIETCLCSGGNIMSRDKVLAAVKKIMEGKEDGKDLRKNKNHPGGQGLRLLPRLYALHRHQAHR